MADEDRHAWERRGTFEVAPGVHRIPLPLPGDGLKAVNVYAIEQPDGIVLIDSGWAIGQAREHLEEGLAALDRDLGMVRRVLVTHVHRDHYELGMTAASPVRVAAGPGHRGAALVVRAMEDEPGEHSPMTHRLRRAGAAPAARPARTRPRSVVTRAGCRWPSGSCPTSGWPTRRASTWTDRTLEVVATPGHTQGHVVFVDEAAGLLFSGDHVLPHITPSIGFEQVPVESALADYLASLSLVRGMPDHRMLPAHGPVRPTTHDRIDELLAHHEHRLRQSADAVAAGNTTAWDVAHALPWTRHERAFDDLDVFNQMLAVNETAAHLDVLVRRGDLVAHDTGDGPVPVRAYATP